MPPVAKRILATAPAVIAHHSVHFIVVSLANGARLRIRSAHQHDQRIGTGLTAALPALVELLADRDVVQLRARDQLLRHFRRRACRPARVSRPGCPASSPSSPPANPPGSTCPATCKSAPSRKDPAPARATPSRGIRAVGLRWAWLRSSPARTSARAMPARSPRKPAPPLEIRQRKIDLLLHVHGLADFSERVSELGSSFADRRRWPGACLASSAAFLAMTRLSQQARLIALDGLQRILDAENFFLRDARVFLRDRRRIS